MKMYSSHFFRCYVDILYASHCFRCYVDICMLHTVSDAMWIFCMLRTVSNAKLINSLLDSHRFRCYSVGWYLVCFTGSGDFYCLHSETIGDVTYTIVWNNDTTVSGTTYRSTCLVRSGYSHSYSQSIVWMNEYSLFVEIISKPIIIDICNFLSNKFCFKFVKNELNIYIQWLIWITVS